MGKNRGLFGTKKEAPLPAAVVAEPPAQTDAPQPEERAEVVDRGAVQPAAPPQPPAYTLPAAAAPNPKVIRAAIGVPTRLAEQIQRALPEPMTLGEGLVRLAECFGPRGMRIALDPTLRPALVLERPHMDMLAELLGRAVQTPTELLTALEAGRSCTLNGAVLDIPQAQLELIEGRIVTGETLPSFLPRLLQAAVDAFLVGALEVPEPLEWDMPIEEHAADEEPLGEETL